MPYIKLKRHLNFLNYSKKRFLLSAFLIFLLSNCFFLFLGLESNGLSLSNPFKIDGDSKDYISSSENLIQGEGFTFFKISEDKEFVSNISSKKDAENELFYAFRSPGFALFYIPFRIFLSKKFAIIGFIFFQTLVNALAKLVLVILTYKLSKNKILSFLLFIILGSVPYFSQYNNLILTDSLGLSFLIFGTYFFITYKHENPNLKPLFIAGAFFTISVFLRPFLILPFAFASILLFFQIISKDSLKKTILVLLCFGSTFLILDSLWIIRNYYHTEKIIPLASTTRFQDHKHSSFQEIKKISGSLGYSNNWWDKESPVCWFYKKEDPRNVNEIFFANKSTKEFKKKILDARNYMFKSLDANFNLKHRVFLEKKSELILKNINRELFENHFFRSQIKSRVSVLLKFIVQPIPRDFHALGYPFNVVLVFYNHLLVNAIVWIGFFASCLFVFTNKNWATAYLSLSILSIIFLFTLVFLSFEYREIYTMIGFLAISAILFLNDFKIKHAILKLSIIIILSLAIAISGIQTVQEIIW